VIARFPPLSRLRRQPKLRGKSFGRPRVNMRGQLPSRGAFLAFPLGGRCRANARRMRGRPREILFAPQGDFCHQTKVTKSWFKNPWFLKISFPQALWLSPLSTGAEVTATVSAIEPLSRFVRHLFYPVPVSSLRLHRFVTVRLRAGKPGPYGISRRFRRTPYSEHDNKDGDIHGNPPV